MEELTCGNIEKTNTIHNACMEDFSQRHTRQKTLITTTKDKLTIFNHNMDQPEISMALTSGFLTSSLGNNIPMPKVNFHVTENEGQDVNI